MRACLLPEHGIDGPAAADDHMHARLVEATQDPQRVHRCHLMAVLVHGCERRVPSNNRATDFLHIDPTCR